MRQGSFVTRDAPVEGKLELCRDGPAGGPGRLLQGHHDEALEPQVNLVLVLGHDGDPLDIHVLEEVEEVGLGHLLQSHLGASLETQVNLEALCLTTKRRLWLYSTKLPHHTVEFGVSKVNEVLSQNHPS